MYQKQEKNTFLNKTDNLIRLLSGAVSGTLSRTAVAPIERLIILRQTKTPKYFQKSLLQSLLTMYKTEGITSLFKGNLANCLRIAPYQSIEFFTFDLYRYYIQNLFQIQKTSTYNTTSMLFCGALAGMTAYTCVYPLDLAKTHLAIHTDSNTRYSINQILSRIYQNEGFFGLYKGMSATLLGCMAVTITYPTDFIRRRLQITQIGNNQKVKLVQFATNIVKQEGFLTLYCGLMTTYVKIIPSTALAFAINEYMKNQFGIY
ncbi:mitochondrial carrier protein, putative [Ichthyophthirius multifiliis]|uniref:Mitochondrial carrier protein, putative n=1 Tax=Ichthyophthirius multifiliis TaxID=5932 RepID=G0QMC5_ICHMU|nr:mitochondrial carrier protein, putative [Ichthyophthirius multifiliis]EGR33619.1 mitochondrial carrier protein, putative [Ichthyophthirius multifiliis]|eukprot:XP_004037605.1 mitochondrial carrier protein, putative [Ichthyophthirius multifiliis]